jgi:dUTP pyrophosphatase
MAQIKFDHIIKVKLLSRQAIIPKKGTAKSAGFDLYVPRDTIIPFGRTVVHTDLAIVPDYGFCDVRPRSGFSVTGIEGNAVQLIDSTKKHSIEGYSILSSQIHFDADVILGTVDNDYRGNVGIIIKNNDVPFCIKAGTRIAQLVPPNDGKSWGLQIVSMLDKTEREEGGYGHTGTR